MKRRTGSILAITATAMAVTAAPAAAETVYGVTAANALVTFDSASPGTITSTVPITGIPVGETVAGIDVRPGTLRLTVLDSAGQLYTLDADSGALTAVGAGVPTAADATDIDFNPTVDRLRVVGTAGQTAGTTGDGNLRLNPNNGALGATDGDLAFKTTPAPADVNAGDVPDIVGSAYTNSFPATQTFPNPPTTTLFDIDAGNDTLVTQAPPNDGVLNTVGALGVTVDAGSDAGFDIVTDADGTTNRAYASLDTGAAAPGFYTINLATGAAAKVGDLPAADPVVDIAVAPVVPTLLALRDRNGRQTIASFAANRPQDVGQGSLRITGLPAGVSLRGIDQRPANGQLYGLGSDSRIYTINLLTGATSAVGTGPFSPALSGTQFGFDFNPMADRIRVVSDTGQNLRINPDTGVGAVAPPSAADGNLNGFSTSATGAAYTNSVKAATATTLFDIDSATDRLLEQAPPNAGTTIDRGPLNQDVAPSNGYDIVPRFNQGFAVSANGLLGVNVASTAPVAPATLGAANGGAVVVGPFPLGVGETVTGLAAFDPALIPPATAPPANPGTTPPGTTPPATLPPTTPAPPAAVKLRTRISATLKPSRDRKSPFRYTLSGRIVPKGTAVAGAFSGGRVTVRAKRTGRTKTLKTVRATVSATGRFSVRITVPGKNLAKRSGKVTLHQSFGGTDTLFSSRAFDRARYR